mmetsp:Transcript_44177/g.70971  ORF Transcript_44177/g.70971 Transcript_44177/m.70971 type:complete len:234 (+) Transcript_44177:114-815(+)
MMIYVTSGLKRFLQLRRSVRISKYGSLIRFHHETINPILERILQRYVHPVSLSFRFFPSIAARILAANLAGTLVFFLVRRFAGAFSSFVASLFGGNFRHPQYFFWISMTLINSVSNASILSFRSCSSFFGFARKEELSSSLFNGGNLSPSREEMQCLTLSDNARKLYPPSRAITSFPSFKDINLRVKCPNACGGTSIPPTWSPSTQSNPADTNMTSAANSLATGSTTKSKYLS